MERWEQIIEIGEKNAKILDEGPCGLIEKEFEGAIPLDGGGILTYFSRNSTANDNFVFAVITSSNGEEVTFTVEYGEHLPRCESRWWKYLTENV